MRHHTLNTRRPHQFEQSPPINHSKDYIKEIKVMQGTIFYKNIITYIKPFLSPKDYWKYKIIIQFNIIKIK